MQLFVAPSLSGAGITYTCRCIQQEKLLSSRLDHTCYLFLLEYSGCWDPNVATLDRTMDPRLYQPAFIIAQTYSSFHTEDVRSKPLSFLFLRHLASF
jgi:hypothetical protein